VVANGFSLEFDWELSGVVTGLRVPLDTFTPFAITLGMYSNP